MTEDRVFDYMNERLESAKFETKLTDEEFNKLTELVEKNVYKDLEEGIPAGSKEMEENIDSAIEYYIEELRNPE